MNWQEASEGDGELDDLARHGTVSRSDLRRRLAQLLVGSRKREFVTSMLHNDPMPYL